MTLETTKSATEDADWSLDWSTKGLGTDTIASFAYDIFPAGLSAHSPTHTATTTTLWFSGGVKGATYRVPITITTAGGRELSDELIVFVEP